MHIFKYCISYLKMLDPNEVASFLQKKVSTMSELQEIFPVNQSTLSRAIQKLEREKRVIQFGKARATQYAHLRKPETASDSILPLYRIDEAGEASLIGKIATIAPQGYAIHFDTKFSLLQSGYFESLPFYLQPARPEGFLGRMLAQKAAHRLPALPFELKQWSDDHVLHFASILGAELPGAFIIGKQAMTHFLEMQPSSFSDEDLGQFETRVQEIERAEPPGSSAGGEWPKFTAFLRSSAGATYSAIIKYSGNGSNQVEQRNRDLLICEHLALTIINSGGLLAAQSKLRFANNRVFLIIERYDRIAEKGRRHYFPLGAVDHDLIADFRHIRQSARWLYENKLLSLDHYAEIVKVSLFGDLIGNTDQHFGNVSLTFNNKSFGRTPAYDVLPMWYAPRSTGALPEGLHEVPVILPEYREFGEQAKEMALQFWHTAVNHPEISDNFREIANSNLQRV